MRTAKIRQPTAAVVNFFVPAEAAVGLAQLSLLRNGQRTAVHASILEAARAALQIAEVEPVVGVDLVPAGDLGGAGRRGAAGRAAERHEDVGRDHHASLWRRRRSAGGSASLDYTLASIRFQQERYEAIIDKHPKASAKAQTAQLATLGGGNHFIEVCLDEEDRVWVMLHSGSRGSPRRFA